MINLKKIIKVSIYGYLPKRDIKGLSFLELYDFISAKELKDRYLKSDICIAPSIFDISPNTVYEAMSYGKVIIAINAGDSTGMRKNARNKILEMSSLQKNADNRLRLFQKIK